MTSPQSVKIDPDNLALLQSASNGFDHLFSNDIQQARKVFSSNNSDPYHFLGLAVCSFLEAALGMESAVMNSASESLAASQELCRKQLHKNKSPRTSRFSPGLEWEVLIADTTVLSGLIHVFSETYVGYMRCLVAMKSAHSKFTKLFKAVFPNGLGTSTNGNTFRRFIGRGSTTSSDGSHTPFEPEGPIEELIISGTAFGYGLFNLILSILPRKIKAALSWLGFSYDQNVAIQALRVAAGRNDAHSVFAGLVLMSFMSLVLQITGWQADTELMRNEYRALVDPLTSRFPTGNLWTLYHAKLMRVTNKQDDAIESLTEGTKPGRVHVFKQADMLLTYELAWTLLGERRYQEAANAFMKMKDLNSWSHATYHFLAAGCYIAIGQLDRAQELLDVIPGLVSKKVAGKTPPSEVFVEKKIEFYKEKQRRNGNDIARYVESIKIGLAEELGIFWNNHAQISQSSARAHIDALSKLEPTLHPSAQPAPTIAKNDLDTPDELAIRSLLLGIHYRTIGDYPMARSHLSEAYAVRGRVKVSMWVGGMSLFETATLDLIEMDAKNTKGHTVDGSTGTREVKPDQTSEERQYQAGWERVLREAERKLDEALELSPDAVDLASRLDGRIVMLREEIRKKRRRIGLTIT
ncbi:hypothetical protein AX15_000828 [Amanita polypyramis BW_CC]|nr:hypothetical protein AX15_000828 [Amanita polypyramis BW_CC]